MRNNIFESVSFLNEDCGYRNLFEGDMKYALCTREILNEAYGDKSLLEGILLEEGRKASKSIMKFAFGEEGKDYKDLRKNLRDLIKMNDLDDEGLKSKGKGFLHCCKRIIQVCLDINVILGTGMAVGAAVPNAILLLTPLAPLGLAYILGIIIGYVVGLLINRALRWGIETIEYSRAEDDAKEIIRQLRSKADKCDKKTAAKLKEQADELEEKLKENRK